MHVNNCIQSTYLLNIDYICMDHTVVCYNVTFSFIPHIAWKRQNKEKLIFKKNQQNKEIKMIKKL